jgi:20S proteasome subunit alpha 4
MNIEVLRDFFSIFQAKLQDERTVQKICVLDNHVMMAFAGLTADARIIIKRARQVCRI